MEQYYKNFQKIKVDGDNLLKQLHQEQQQEQEQQQTVFFYNGISYFKNLKCQNYLDWAKMFLPLKINEKEKTIFEIRFDDIIKIYKCDYVLDIFILTKKTNKINTISLFEFFSSENDNDNILVDKTDMDLIRVIDTLNITKTIMYESDDEILFKVPFCIYKYHYFNPKCNYKIEFKFNFQNYNQNDITFYAHIIKNNNYGSTVDYLNILINSNSQVPYVYGHNSFFYEIKENDLKNKHTIIIPHQYGTKCICHTIISMQ